MAKSGSALWVRGLVWALCAAGLCVVCPGRALAAPDAAAGNAVRPAFADEDRALFAAAHRPRLIRAGFGKPEEALEGLVEAPERPDDLTWEGFLPDRGPAEADTRLLSDALWQFSPFPTVRDGLLNGLLQADLPAGQRLERFWGEGRILALALEALATQRDLRTVSRLDFRPAAVRAYWADGEKPADPYGRTPAKREDPGAFAARKAVASFFLPLLYAALEEEAPPAHLARLAPAGRGAYRPWSLSDTGKEVPLWRPQQWEDAGQIGCETARALLKAGVDPSFAGRAEAFFRSGAGAPLERLSALPLVREGLSPADVLLRRSLAALNWFSWGDAGLRYGFPVPGGCGDADEAELRLARWMKGLPRVPADERAAPGLELRELAGPPSLVGAPPLYLVVEAPRLAAEPWREKCAAAPRVFAGTALEGMKTGPRLLRLRPGEPDDAAALAWYLENRDKTRDGFVLLASPLDEAALRLRLTAWFLGMWEDEGGTSPVYQRPCSDSFLTALLPGVKGRAAAVFVAPGERLWFWRPGVSGGRWVEAAPEQGRAPGPEQRAEKGQAASARPQGCAALAVPTGLVASFERQFRRDTLERAALEIMREAPKSDLAGNAALAFLSKAVEDLDAAGKGQDWSYFTRLKAAQLLWRLHGTAQEAEGRRLLLESGAPSLGTRMAAVKKLLHIKE